MGGRLDPVWVVHGHWLESAALPDLVGIPGEENRAGPCEQLDELSLFNYLSTMRRKEDPWTDPIDPTP